jgi:hypothetical protein
MEKRCADFKCADMQILDVQIHSPQGLSQRALRSHVVRIAFIPNKRPQGLSNAIKLMSFSPSGGIAL